MVNKARNKNFSAFFIILDDVIIFLKSAGKNSKQVVRCCCMGRNKPEFNMAKLQHNILSMASLLIFTGGVIRYFVTYREQTAALGAPQSIMEVCFKISPILSLIFFDLTQANFNFWTSSKYHVGIFIGLLFSAIGDTLLEWQSLFTYGMIAFACTQLSYAISFGFSPLKLPVLLLYLAIAGVPGYLYLLPGLVDNVMNAVFTAIYFLLVIIMVWRATCRVDCKSFLSILTLVGAISFALSDYIIGYDNFRMKVENYNLLVMTTYYFAQLTISLSVLEYSKNKSKKTK